MPSRLDCLVVSLQSEALVFRIAAYCLNPKLVKLPQTACLGPFIAEHWAPVPYTLGFLQVLSLHQVSEGAGGTFGPQNFDTVIVSRKWAHSKHLFQHDVALDAQAFLERRCWFNHVGEDPPVAGCFDHLLESRNYVVVFGPILVNFVHPTDTSLLGRHN